MKAGDAFDQTGVVQKNQRTVVGKELHAHTRATEAVEPVDHPVAAWHPELCIDARSAERGFRHLPVPDALQWASLRLFRAGRGS